MHTSTSIGAKIRFGIIISNAHEREALLTVINDRQIDDACSYERRGNKYLSYLKYDNPEEDACCYEFKYNTLMCFPTIYACCILMLLGNSGC